MIGLKDFDGYLMSEDTVLGIIENGELVRIVDAVRLPFHFIYADDPSLEKWVHQRAVDISRTNSRFLLREIAEEAGIEQAVLSVNAASVTDTYWLKEAGSDLTYEQIRFKSDDLARVALLGSSAGVHNPVKQSAEITSIGSFEKCWRIEDGKWWLYKSGDPAHTFSELLCYEIGRYLGIEMAHYENVTREEVNRIFNCRVVSSFSAVKTLDFTDGASVNFEPAIDLGCSRSNAAKNYEILYALSPQAARQYQGMVLLDALVYNGDRHLFNFGILRDVETGEVLRLSPVYDQNLAVWMSIADYDIIMSNQKDNLFVNWARMTDAIGEAVHIPPLSREVFQSVMERIDFPAFEKDDREALVDVLSLRGQWIADKVQQINKVYPEPVPIADMLRHRRSR